MTLQNAKIADMHLIIGLGNPGEKYKNTRHNVGFMVLDEYNAKQGPDDFSFNKKFNSEIIKTEKVILAKPQTFMNDSGSAVSKLISFFKINPTELYVVHDDLDIKLGEYKIQKGVGPKVHNGVNSIEEKLGTKNFWRVRMGVDNRIPESRIPGEEYVLQNFEEQEIQILQSMIEKVVQEILKNASRN